MAEPNPNPSLITDELWDFSQQCLDREPGTQMGGIYADKSGFHNTVNANLAKWPGNYSTKLPILRQEPKNKARAFDWVFPEAKNGNYTRINFYSQRLLVASQARDPRLSGLYEWFGTRDGANIGYNCWKGYPVGSDDSHDWHLHFGIVTPYVVSTGLFDGILSVLFSGMTGGDDMLCKYGDDNEKVAALQAALRNLGHGEVEVSGVYDDVTAAAVLSQWNVGDGRNFGPWEWGAMIGQGSGKPGPRGLQGIQGVKGDPGDLVGRTITLTGQVTQV